jgi:hypothetical protein
MENRIFKRTITGKSLYKNKYFVIFFQHGNLFVEVKEDKNKNIILIYFNFFENT